MTTAQTSNHTNLLNVGLTAVQREHGLFHSGEAGEEETNSLFAWKLNHADANFYTNNNNILRKILLNLLDEIHSPTIDSITQNDVIYILVPNNDGTATYTRVVITENSIQLGENAANIDSFSNGDGSGTIKKPKNVYFLHAMNPDDLTNIKAQLLDLNDINVISQDPDCWQIGHGSDSNSSVNFMSKGDEHNCQLHLDAGANGTVQLLNKNLP